jgi:hypothetical protein
VWWLVRQEKPKDKVELAARHFTTLCHGHVHTLCHAAVCHACPDNVSLAACKASNAQTSKPATS